MSECIWRIVNEFCLHFNIRWPNIAAKLEFCGLLELWSIISVILHNARNYLRFLWICGFYQRVSVTLTTSLEATSCSLGRGASQLSRKPRVLTSSLPALGNVAVTVIPHNSFRKKKKKIWTPLIALMTVDCDPFPLSVFTTDLLITWIKSDISCPQIARVSLILLSNQHLLVSRIYWLHKTPSHLEEILGKAGPNLL